ncbi:SDR family oxidoreductase [Rhizosaccharibacter radicis]|uniref:SDR family oxidoreductase n=1 Tax=Rhizosaccharibacter radicis TaxID=2782605 RepID=A0ABT1W0J3_9PROT|nr:SDR family oxidoreductase [Acetobacteraceae bacterium KSS12]
MDTATDYYRNKVAVVTGAAAGIGLALVEAMLDRGAAAAVLLDRDAAMLERQAERLAVSYPGRILAVVCDVSVGTEVVDAITAAHAFGKRIDLLFNNAGLGLSGRFDELDDEDWTRAFAVNFFGPLHAIRAVLPIMRDQRGGHIVDVVSGIALTPMAQQSMYAASKAALNALTLALRYELWDENIRLTSATPGTTATGIWEKNGGRPPANAQSPAQAAAAILAGVARNERFVPGDAGDARGARVAFDPAMAAELDAYLLDVARRRRRGETAV